MNDAKSESLSIVMLDDDAEDVYSMRRAFTMCDHPPKFESVSSAAALFDHLDRASSSESDESGYPSLILIDLNLPKMSGYDVLKRLKSEPSLSCIPAVVFTTSDSKEDCARSYQAGANAFLTKPASFGDTKRTASAIIEFWRLCPPITPRSFQ